MSLTRLLSVYKPHIFSKYFKKKKINIISLYIKYKNPLRLVFFADFLHVLQLKAVKRFLYSFSKVYSPFSTFVSYQS